MARNFSLRPTAYFRSPPKTDAVCMSKWARNLTQPVLNGFFQHIVWMGVSSYAFINHFDREILLVDPWPSYKKSGELHRALDWRGQNRLMRLANWLRAKNGGRPNYRVVGILLSHEHYDHVDDMVSLHDLLLMPRKEKCPQHWRIPLPDRKRRVVLSGRAFTPEEMPKIICDNDIRNVLHSQGARGFVYDVVMQGKKPVHVSDDYAKVHGSPVDAGLKCRPKQAGKYVIQPYIWDHSNTACGHTGEGDFSGNWQRQLAFHIARKGVAEAKSTFLISSAGEMGEWGTDNHVVPQLDNRGKPAPIRADLLIQGVPVPLQRRYKTRVKEMLTYHASNMDVSDRILASHWDKFAGGPAQKLSASPSPFRKYLDHMKKEGKGKGVLAQHGKAKESNKLSTMKRSIFHAEDEIPGRGHLLFPDKSAS